MRILIDIGHPAHVHLFKCFTDIMQKRNHKILFTARNKDVSVKLLGSLNFDYISFGNNFNTSVGKFWGIVKFCYLLIKVSVRFKPDLFISAGSYYLAITSIFFRIPNISLHNSETDIFVKLMYPLTSHYLTPFSFSKRLGSKQIKYNGNHELAFLHPDNFRPDPSILASFGLTESDKFVLLRFVSFNAFDDKGFGKGINHREKREIVNTFKKYGKILISSENELPSDLATYHIEKNDKYVTGLLQNIEYYATLLFGESGAMTAECAILGTPAFYVNRKKLGFINELENKYKLVYNYDDYNQAIKKAVQLISQNNLKSEWKRKADFMLKTNINVTNFLVWFIEEYPQSATIMKSNPDFQFKFY